MPIMLTFPESFWFLQGLVSMITYGLYLRQINGIVILKWLMLATTSMETAHNACLIKSCTFHLNNGFLIACFVYFE